MAAFRAGIAPKRRDRAVLSVAILLVWGCSVLPPRPDASTGAVPAREAAPAAGAGVDAATLRADVQEVVEALGANREGEVYAQAVEGTDPEALAVAVALVDGRAFAVGDEGARFPLMSVSKPFTLALVAEQRGGGFVLEKIGMSATGFPYNSVAAGAVRPTTAQNPLVNAGAIAAHGYVQGASSPEKIGAVVDLYARMAGRPLQVEERWRAQPRALTLTLGYQMAAAGRLEGDVHEVAQRYLEACIVAVGVGDLARMGATLASGGIQPGTGRRVLRPETVRVVLSAMVVAGMYEASGTWWTRVGLPAKSGVSGAILAVVPGWGALVAYSPRLDPAGNSVRGGLAIAELAQRWQLHSLDRLIHTAPPGSEP